MYGAKPGDSEHGFANNCLLARRLAERGVRFIQLYHGDWDHHSKLIGDLQARCKETDQATAALILDLKQRGMLDETLVICMSEMGRNPVLGKSVTGAAVNAADPDGRNHWQYVWTGVFAGGGVRGGNVVGQSDEWAGYPDGEGYYPSDMGATIYTALGIDPRTEVRDLQDRPNVLNEGHVIEKLF